MGFKIVWSFNKMGEELNTVSLSIGITASVLYIASELLAWSKCDSNSVSQFIFHNFVCTVEREEPPPTPPPVIVEVRDDLDMVCICNKE